MKIEYSDKIATILPLLNESYCSVLSNGELQINVGLNSILRFIVILIASLSIIFSNLVFIVTINSEIYLKISNQQSQFRYLLTCLAINDFSVGVLVTAAAIMPSLFQCWPFSGTFCQIQASLRGVLPRQSVVILMCTAVDRYLSVQHPKINRKCFTNKVCLMTICLSLIIFLLIFVTIVVSKQGYYFNNSGLLACDIFYFRPSFRILSACMFYFPATLLFMYCYGSLYHFSYKKYSLSSLRNFNLKSSKSPQKREKVERDNKITSRKMGLISFMFIVTSTPWFINEMVVGGTGYRVSSFFEFVFTWTALSNSFWNPFLYWMLDKHFRKSCVDILIKTKDSQNRKLTLKSTPVHHCRNVITSLDAIECDIIEKSSLENHATIETNLPDCPTPPPPPRLKHTILIPLY